MCVAQLSYYHGGVKSFVNIDSFEDQGKHACERLSKPLKMDGIQKQLLKHGKMLTHFFCSKNILK
jgi:hypothetical protein